MNSNERTALELAFALIVVGSVGLLIGFAGHIFAWVFGR